jgi:D-amino-acid oxidase
MRDQTVNRRTAIARGLAAIAGLGVSACAPAARTRIADPRHSGSPRLAPVNVSEHRLIRSVAGLRPYRRSGFRVDSERFGEKLLVHNYGHGGAGVTLSWGTAALAVEHALRAEHRDAAVLGCGAVGLATARLLQDHGFRVRIYARELPPNTTSNLAGALWAPFGVADAEQRERPFAQVLARASRVSHRYFQTLVGDRYGVRWFPLYLLGESGGAALHWTWQLTPELFNTVSLEPGQHPFAQRSARRTHVLMIEPESYLRAVLADFRLAGGEVVVRSFSDRAAVLALEEPLVVNCTGLGARALFGDTEVIPAKGQLSFLLPQAEVDYLYLAGGYYMFPRTDGILLGGTFELGEWSTDADPAATARILEGNRRIAETLL